MLKTCKHSTANCAVCKNIEDRDVFKVILKKMHPEVFFCEHAVYQVTNYNGAKFIITSLEYLLKGKKGYYIQDLFSESRVIYLGETNFKVLCTCRDECLKIEPFVKEYIPKQKNKAAN